MTTTDAWRLGVAVAAAVLLLAPARLGSPAGRARRWSPRWWGVVPAAGVAGLVVGAPRAAVLVVVLGGAAGGAQRLWRVRARAARGVVTRDRVLECCDLLVAELVAGQDPGAALRRASEAWPDLLPVAQTHALGGDVPAALRRCAETHGAAGLGRVAAAWQVAHRTGHGLADAVGRVAAGLRAERATDRVVRAELASARATARLVGLLPLFALAIGTGSGGRPVAFLVGRPLGLACLAGGLALGLAGLAWIERIASEVGA